MNKVAVVTGGVRRLGRQISYFLAAEGYSLALIYNSSKDEELKKTSGFLKSKKVDFKLYKCDLRNLPQVKKTIAKIGSDFKKFDLLVNNSGMITKIDFRKITPKLFEDTLNLNLRAALFVSQYSLKYLMKSHAPLIINMASLGGMQNWNNFIPYSLSKTALIKLTYLLAKELAPKVRVNAISPGTIVIEGEKAGTPGIINVEKIPLKKYGSSKDIISAVKFIIDNGYLTGHVIPVDGGRLLNN